MTESKYTSPRMTAGDISTLDLDGANLIRIGFAIIYFKPANIDRTRTTKLKVPEVGIDCESFNWSGRLRERGRTTFIGAVNQTLTDRYLYLANASRIGDNTLQGDLYSTKLLC